MSARLQLSWLPSLMIVVGMMVVSSCKDDEKPKSKFSFAESEIEALEDDGTVEYYDPPLKPGVLSKLPLTNQYKYLFIYFSVNVLIFF